MYIKTKPEREKNIFFSLFGKKELNNSLDNKLTLMHGRRKENRELKTN